MPKSMSYQCKACGATVSQKHLLQHLQLSRNPQCQVYLQEIRTAELADSNSVSDNESAPNLSPPDDNFPGPFDFEAPMVSPRGDYFGEYDDLEMQEDEMDVDQESLINGDSNNSDQPVDFEDEDPDNEATLEADEAEEEAVPELARPTVSDPHGSGVGADSQDDFNSEDSEAEGDSELEIEDLTQWKETEEQLQ
ncbi:hypothetical protein BYT27DRAFT_7255644 [Phlegmacium glaucopus]|nr:hypothetical protein BYT27DRAFT_7255644 [Phlegmacium glaucopus]